MASATPAAALPPPVWRPASKELDAALERLTESGAQAPGFKPG